MTTPNPWSRYDRRVLACSRPRSRRHQAAAASHIRADSICPSHFYLLAATWDKYVTKYVFQQSLNRNIKTDALFSFFLLSPLPSPSFHVLLSPECLLLFRHISSLLPSLFRRFVFPLFSFFLSLPLSSINPAGWSGEHCTQNHTHSVLVSIWPRLV